MIRDMMRQARRVVGMAFEAAGVIEEEGSNGSVVLRRGHASLALSASRDVPGMGAGLLIMPRVMGASVGVGVPGLAVSVGVAMRRTNWVDWEQWVLSRSQTDDSREVLAWATRTHLFWRLWVRPRHRSSIWRPELRQGNATWDRLLLGRRRSRVISSVKTPAKVRMTEGAYDADVTVTVRESWRSRFPAFRRRASETVVHCDVGIARPDGRSTGIDPSCSEVLDRYFMAQSSSPEDAAREWAAALTRERLTRGGADWRPSTWVRRRRDPGLARFPWLQTTTKQQAHVDDAEADGVEVEGGEAWEVRDPMTGKWSPWQKPPGDALPEGVVERNDFGGIAGLVAIAGIVLGGVGLVSSLLEDA